MPIEELLVDDVTIKNIKLERATFKEAEEFKHMLTQDIENKKLKVVVDLSDCLFMDSTFLSALVTSLKKITEAGGNLKLVVIRPETLSLLELTGTYKVFEIFHNRESAVNSFK
ncbi:MAG: STAS domain-containing protein [Ignavibacteriaceae bacterium]|nr:STAS domain-containing protein [Ignavibacteriaceae bacterium]